MLGDKNPNVLVRAIAFDIRPTPDDIGTFMRASGVLRELWNEIHTKRAAIDALWAIPKQELKEAHEAENEELAAELEAHIERLNSERKRAVDARKELDERIEAVKKRISECRTAEEKQTLDKELETLYAERRTFLHLEGPRPRPTKFDWINSLTERDTQGLNRQLLEETIKRYYGAAQSKKGNEMGGRRARFAQKLAEHEFCEIRGRTVRIGKEGDQSVYLRLGEVNGKKVMRYPIPDYQWREITVAGAEVKSFTLFRANSDLREQSGFRIALSFEIPKPPETRFVPEEAAFLVTGSDIMAVARRCCVPAFDPQSFWGPRIETIEAARAKEKARGGNLKKQGKKGPNGKEYPKKNWRLAQLKAASYRMRRELAEDLGIDWRNVELVLPLPRPDRHWKPVADEIGDPRKQVGHEKRGRFDEVVKDSAAYRELLAARREAYRHMREQQKLSHREMADWLLDRVGPNIVVLDVSIRGGKPDALADAGKPEQGGAPDGRNWRTQNTGNMADLILQLTTKAPERGGRVIRHQFSVPPTLPKRSRRNAHEMKIARARALREDFLRTRAHIDQSSRGAETA
ncbi:MAG: hypothetical protein WDN10_01305 [bacterium]